MAVELFGVTGEKFCVERGLLLRSINSVRRPFIRQQGACYRLNEQICQFAPVWTRVLRGFAGQACKTEKWLILLMVLREKCAQIRARGLANVVDLSAGK